MTSPLTQCREYLLSQYSALSDGDKFAFVADFNKESAGKVKWVVVSRDDLASRRDSAETADAVGLLVDPEVGILCYFIPYKDGDDLTPVLLKALEHRSKLLPELNYVGSNRSTRDVNGPWHIVLYWLVGSESAKLSWLKQADAVRSKTGHLEEVPIDLVNCFSADWGKSFKEHGLPRLLFATRAMFRRRAESDVQKWMSADELVMAALSTLKNKLSDPAHRLIADEVVGEAKKAFEKGVVRNVSTPTTGPRRLHSVSLEHFRNFEELSFDFEPTRVSALVINGPNGIGKSSIYEALSLGLYRSSARYGRFCDDADITSVNKPAEYLKNYLRPFNGLETQEPRVHLDKKLVEITPLDLGETVDWEVMNGTMLSQETSERFVFMPANDLARIILKGYSDLAEQITSFVQRRYDSANTTRQSFLRDLGVNASIKRMDTAKARIVSRRFEKYMPRKSAGLIEWLELKGSSGESAKGSVGMVLTDWRQLDGNDARDTLYDRIAEATSSSGMALAVSGWLTAYNELCERSNTEVNEVFDRELKNLPPDVAAVIQMLELWGAWLESRSDTVTKEEGQPELQKLEKEIEGLAKKQGELVSQGRHIRSHLDHVSNALKFVKEHWNSDHPDTCPTCGTDLGARNGVLSVVEQLNQELGQARDRALADYQQVTTALKELQTRASQIGKLKAPLSEADMALLEKSFRGLASSDKTFEASVADRNLRRDLTRRIELLYRRPSIPDRVDAQNVTKQICDAIQQEYDTAERVFYDPNNWEAVKATLDKELRAIVQDRLPDTLGRLWMEIVLNMTSSPWLMPARPSFAVKAARGTRRVDINVSKTDEPRDALARYILNQAEVHIMGLAWFFCRYLTVGRFHSNILVMDDPAQEMDQTTFRDFCRLVEGLARLHRFHDRDLSLLLLLHQEERALSATRELGATLKVLGWDKQSKVKTIKLLSDGFVPPSPEQTILKAYAEPLTQS